MNVALFRKDFQKGTELSSCLFEHNLNVTFAESIYDLPDHCDVGIIDLDDEKFGNSNFISDLKKQSGIKLIGYMAIIKKGQQDIYKKAGCEIIISKASVLKNITNILSEN